MNQKTRFNILLAFVFFFSFSFVFPAGGVLSGSSSPLHVIRTEYFDIIFPEESRECASKIEAVCDDYYVEICALLETQPYQRFPVTITHSVESMNAYYSAIPYNRIVLFDTLPEKSLDMYENTIQSVFYHELTHAVTYNIKAKPLRALSFFADCLNPAWLTVTTFWAEGATVSFESKGRGGRLNDPFATQIVSQSVIEGHFPSWRDVTGARDTYPGGTDGYMFGSMFAAYLQETYGMKKYAEFWEKAGSTLTPSFIAGVFERTYGRSITSVWKEFEKTLGVESSPKKADLLSHKKSRVTTFDVFFGDGEMKIAYFDTASSSLRLETFGADGKLKKNKKLLAITGITRVSFSPDGKKLALSRIISKDNSKSVSAEYDLVKKRYREHSTTGRREAYFWSHGGKIELSEIVMDEVKDELFFSPIGIDDDLRAIVVKDSLKWKIRFLDAEKTLVEYDFSEIPAAFGESEWLRNLIVHNIHKLHCADSEILLSFTWAELGMGGKMLSRTGILKIDRASWAAEILLQKENGFAGVIEAIPSLKIAEFFDGGSDGDDFSDEKKCAAFIVAGEYDKNPLYQIEVKESDFEKISLAAKKIAGEEENAKNPAEITGEILGEDSDEHSDEISDEISDESLAEDGKTVEPHRELSYNPFRYYRHGIILPLSMIGIFDHELKQDSTAYWGASFISTNPWGDRRIDFSAGYDSSYKDGGMKLEISGGDDSLKYSLGGTCIFDKDGFMQNFDTFLFEKFLWRGKVASFSVGTEDSFLYGRQIIDDDLEKGRDDSNAKSADVLAFIQFTNIHKVSPRPYYLAGFTLKPFVLGSYRDTEKRPVEDKYLNAGATLTVKFPVLIPFIFTASLFPSSKYAASGSAQAILFDLEIHKGIPAVSLFLQRFVLSTTYSGKISYVHEELWDVKRSKEIFNDVTKEDYSDAIKFAADFYFSPNTGFIASGDMQFSLGYAVIYRPNPKPTEKNVSYGISVSAVY